MPGGNGKGPRSGGFGQGFGHGQGRGGLSGGAGPGGVCYCPQCGKTVPHKRGVPCNSLGCPQCGVSMIRQ